MTLQPADLDCLEQLAREATPEAWDQWDWASWREVTSDRWSLDAFQLRPNVALTIALSPAVVSELVAAARLGAAGMDVDAVPEPLRVPGSLDVAWTDAEKAVPAGYSIGVTSTVNVASGPYVATTDYGDAAHGFAYGPTPAAALTALAEALRERP